MWVMLLALGCGETVRDRRSDPTVEDSASPSLSFVVAPALSRSGPPGLALARRLDLTTDRPTEVEVVARGGDDLVVQHFPPAEQHILPVVGLLPDTTYTVQVRAVAAGGEAVESTLELVTDPLPEPFPNIDLLALESDRMEPGLTLLSISVVGGDSRYVAAFDQRFRARWVLGVPGHLTDARVVDGEFWILQSAGVEHRDVLGRVLTRWETEGSGSNAVAVDVGGFHHEAYPLADGFLSLGRATQVVPDYPRPTDPLGQGKASSVYVPRLVHIGREGSVLLDVDLGEVLDLKRLSMSSGEQTTWGLDWGHANAATPDGDGWLVSLRHQDAIVRLTADGGLDWILSNPTGWWSPLAEHRLQPQGEMHWPYHTHAPERMPDGGLLVFDNGNYQTTPYHPHPPARPELSRVVAYDIDPDARTVEERWAIATTRTGPLFSEAVGDADYLPQTGHVLAVYGRLQGEGEIDNAAVGRGLHHARVIEVDPQLPELPVLDVRVWSSPETVPEGWTVYRAQRFERLHPSVVLPGEPGWDEAARRRP